MSAIPRTAVTGSLKLARLPLDLAISLLPGNGSGASAAASLALDRADAAARAVAGTILNDPVLREDASARSAAARERGRALHLRQEAQETKQDAEARLDERQEDSERRRREAAERERAERERAARRRDAKVERADDAADQRRQTNRKVASQVKEDVEKRARETRLSALDVEAAALAEKDEVIAARDEARRLRQAASAKKARRKRD